MKKAVLFSSDGFVRRCGLGWCGAALIGGAVLCAPGSRAGTLVTDPKDIGDSSGDIRSLGAEVRGDVLYLSMTVDGVAAPSVENTPEGMVNRYYYHWLIDTDNNPATGRSNAEYEGSSTGITTPLGAEVVVQVGWRDGKPNGVYAFDALDTDVALVTGFSFQASGNSITAAIPLAALGLVQGQTTAISGFQEGASEGWVVDWAESATFIVDGPAAAQAHVSDPVDLGDTSGDIRGVNAHVVGDYLMLSMTVEGIAGPALTNTAEGMVNRYYYHWLIDTDNNPATGRSNAEYEGVSTGLERPLGAEVVVMVGWRDGTREGIEVYEALNDENLYLANFPVHASGNTLTAIVPLSALGVVRGQTVAISAFQEGASEGWLVDWVESAELVLEGPNPPVALVEDGTDMGDSSGDIRLVAAYVSGDELWFTMTVEDVAAPAVLDTPEGMVNRYYYHWLLDTDNNPATGRSNMEYEGTPTNLENPIGSELVIQVGWRDGAPDGIYVIDALTEEPTLEGFPFQASGNTLTARVPLAALGLTLGQTVALSAFQEGASEGWKVDWVESAELVLESGVENTGPGLTIENDFFANAFGFEIVLTDDAEAVADAQSVELWLDDVAVTGEVSKTGGVTTISGRHGALLEAESVHGLKLSVDVSGETQSREFVFTVDPYTVLPTAGRLSSVDEQNTGFLIYPTTISDTYTFVASVHSNRADLAEQQLRGGFIDPNTSEPYINEVYFFPEEGTPWKGPGYVEPGVINWFENAGVSEPSLNFPNSALIPDLWDYPVEGIVVEILTYLELTEGQHKLGLYTEGGHKVSAGLSAASPVISVVDNSGEVERVPSYFARNQFFDVVAPEDGFYPIRVLWFQSSRREEPGVMLEFFSVADKELHLVNDSADPLALKAYRAGILLNPGQELPTVALSVAGGGLSVNYTGTLEAAPTVDGPWEEIGAPGESPVTLQAEGTARFLRSKN